MKCLLWIQHLIDVPPQFLLSFVQYLTIVYRVITALDCDTLRVIRRANVELESNRDEKISPCL